jgi:hydroxymethylpyrimidine/phosphomethylpyrimidine kinase
MTTTTPPVALTIAGSDSGGGAGIQADLVTFAALGVHGTSAVTALTAQNTVGVDAVHVPPVEFLGAQLDAVLSDLRVGATKTGMLGTEDVIRHVADRAARGRLPNLVVDPVLVSSTGARLLDPGAERAYLDELFPYALVITPNTREAAALLGHDVVTVTDARAAAYELGRYGAWWVVVKGGHLDAGDDAVDVALEVMTGEVTELRRPRVDHRAAPPPGRHAQRPRHRLHLRGRHHRAPGPRLPGPRRPPARQDLRPRGPPGVRPLAPRPGPRPGRQARLLAPLPTHPLTLTVRG